MFTCHTLMNGTRNKTEQEAKAKYLEN